MTTRIDSEEKLTTNPWYWTVLFIILGFVIERLTQYFIRAHDISTGIIIDRLQVITLPLNHYFQIHTGLTKMVLITTSLWFDFSCIFLSARAIFGPSIRPYLSLFLFLILRQCMQMLVFLPIPKDIIWYYPGFPSLLVDYSALGDFYFSAHTGISLLCALELARLGNKWLTLLGYLFFAYMVSMVITFRAHYTMDVFTAVLVVFLVTYLSNRWSPYIDNFLRSIGRKKHMVKVS